jgi:hypothetical protein
MGLHAEKIGSGLRNWMLNEGKLKSRYPNTKLKKLFNTL